ncbi:MAG TPA: carbon storage regulator [Pirellulales bacterium]|nr:carbon storage regulator [Pirellulales bacterium]
MLVLSRKESQKIQIGPNITITLLNVRGNRAKIAVDAPLDCRVLRGELTDYSPAASESPSVN